MDVMAEKIATRQSELCVSLSKLFRINFPSFYLRV